MVAAGVIRCGAAALAAWLAACSLAAAQDCSEDPRRSGIARTIAVDSEGGPTIGKLQYHETLPLKKGEVVLTFDDGPLPAHTRSVLDTLDRHCVKAVFFSVGSMAWANRAMIREVARRGHTIGTHSWSHPRSMAEQPFETAKMEIEKGFAGVTAALGGPVAPFFRFPGLNASPQLIEYLQSRNISIWSVDVVSGDTNGTPPAQLVEDTIRRVKSVGKGIILFHDIRANTAEALEPFLNRLKEEGFKIVNVVSNSAFKPDESAVAMMDFNKTQRAISFTGVDPAGIRGLNALRAMPVVATGSVDVLRTEWVDLESLPTQAPSTVRLKPVSASPAPAAAPAVASQAPAAPQQEPMRREAAQTDNWAARPQTVDGALEELKTLARQR